MAPDAEVVGNGLAAQRARLRDVVRRHDFAVGITQRESRERSVVDRLRSRAKAEHRQRRLVHVDDATLSVVDPESVSHRAEDRIEPRRALGHHSREPFDLVLRLDLFGHVLNEDGHALSDAGESSAHCRDDAIDVHRRRAAGHLVRFIESRLARFRDLLQRLLESRQHFGDAQADQLRVGKDRAEVFGEIDEARVRELEPQLIGRDDGDADRRRFDDCLESHTRIDFAPRQLFRGAVAFLRNARQSMNVRRRADAFRDRLGELEIFGVEVAAIVGSRDDQRPDAIAV